MAKKAAEGGATGESGHEVPNFQIPLRNCSNCTFYHHKEGPSRTVAHARLKTGECRKYAPRPAVSASAAIVVPNWPTVTNLMHCWEFVQADD